MADWDDWIFPGDPVGGGWRRLHGTGGLIDHDETRYEPVEPPETDAEPPRLHVVPDPPPPSAYGTGARHFAFRELEDGTRAFTDQYGNKPEPEPIDEQLAAMAIVKHAQAGRPWAVRIIRQWLETQIETR
jgi:hypothetical protein